MINVTAPAQMNIKAGSKAMLVNLINNNIILEFKIDLFILSFMGGINFLEKSPTPKIFPHPPGYQERNNCLRCVKLSYQRNIRKNK